jgi:hypothetical protein
MQMQMQWRVLQLADVVRLETVELASRQQVHEAQVMMMLSLSIAVCGVDAKEGATGEEEQARKERFVITEVVAVAGRPAYFS